MTQSSNYGLKNFIVIANEYVNPDLTTQEGIEKFLVRWYCKKFNVPLWHSDIQAATLEELLVFFYIHRIEEDPSVLDDLDPSLKSYEDWMKEQMGESYLTEEEMTEEMIKLQKEEVEKAKELDLPESISTDFSSISNGDEE